MQHFFMKHMQITFKILFHINFLMVGKQMEVNIIHQWVSFIINFTGSSMYINMEKEIQSYITLHLI